MTAARAIAIALVAAASITGAALLLGGGGDQYRVRLEVADAAGLRINSDVKIGGVRAGTVKKMSVTKDDHAIVDLQLEKAAAPIGAGASARIRPVNLLGEKYVDLNPGNLGAPQPSGARIPIGRTSTPVELDDVLNALDPDVRARLRLLLNEGGVALLGRGADVNRLLATLPDTTEEVTAMLADVTAQTAALQQAITSGQRVATAMNARSGGLDRLVAQADRALAPLADRRAQLGATIRTAPAALGTLQRTLRSLDGTATRLQTTARQIRVAAPPLAGTLQALPGFTAAAHDTLRQAQASAPGLTRLANRATPVLRRLQPTAARLRQTATLADPVTKTIDEAAGDSALQLMENWSRTITGRDGLGHVFRTHISLDSGQFLQHALERLAPPAAKRKRPGSKGTPVLPVVHQLLPTLPRAPAKPLVPKLGTVVQQVGDTVDQLVGSVLHGPGTSRSEGSGDPLGHLIDSLLAP